MIRNNRVVIISGDPGSTINISGSNIGGVRFPEVDPTSSAPQHLNDPASTCCGRLWREITNTTTRKCTFALYLVALIVTIALLVIAPSTSLSGGAKIGVGIAALAPFVLFVLYKEGRVLCCCRQQIPQAADRGAVIDGGIPTFDELVRENPHLQAIVNQNFSVKITSHFSSSAGRDTEESSYDGLNAETCRSLIENIQGTHAKHAGQARLQYNVQIVFKGQGQAIPFTWNRS
jgi:hypothetical protein